MKKAHMDMKPRALNYGNEYQDSIIESRNKIQEILRKSKVKPKEMFFESILDNFF